MIIRWKGMRPPLAKARKEGGHARRSAIINVKPAPRTSKEESDRKEKSGDFEAQTIVGHGGPDDAGSSGGARPPGDRCSTAARYAQGELDDGGTGTGRPRRPRECQGRGVRSEGVLHALGHGHRARHGG